MSALHKSNRTSFVPRSEGALVAAVLACALACGDETLVLGSEVPRPYRFDEPEVIAELSISAKADNPSLTGDLLEIYFTASDVPGFGGEIWAATRDGADAPFGQPRRVDELRASASEPILETSPVISDDGLRLWLASDRPGGSGDLDIWVATRAARSAVWSEPVDVETLNSPGKEIPRPLGQGQRVMPLASDRERAGFYRLYLAERPGPGAPFGAPRPLEELTFAGESTVDGFLTDDGLSLFYATGPEIGPADLYVASRRRVGDPFEAPVPLLDLNTASDERDPWLSRDGSLFFFASDRSGRYEIYVARARRQDVAIATP